MLITFSVAFIETFNLFLDKIKKSKKDRQKKLLHLSALFSRVSNK